MVLRIRLGEITVLWIGAGYASKYAGCQSEIGQRRPDFPILKFHRTAILATIRHLGLPLTFIRINRGQSVGQLGVLIERPPLRYPVTALSRRIADPEHALRMVEHALAIPWIARHQLARGLRRLLERGRRRAELAAGRAEFADHLQRAGAAGEFVGVQ